MSGSLADGSFIEEGARTPVPSSILVHKDCVRIPIVLSKRTAIRSGCGLLRFILIECLLDVWGGKIVC